MREHGHEKWTLGGYQSGRFPGTKWAPSNLTLSGIRLHCEEFPDKRGNRDGPLENVPFEALAIDVTRFPEGDDALDLTRCVTWAVNNPASGLLYPRDFQWLTAQLGGPLPVARINQDRAVFSRWVAASRARKAAISNARSRYNKAHKLCTASKEVSDKYRHVLAQIVPVLEVHDLTTPPPAIATIVDGAIVVNAARVPPSLPGPTAQAVAQYLASFAPLQPSQPIPHPQVVQPSQMPNPQLTVVKPFQQSPLAVSSELANNPPHAHAYTSDSGGSSLSQEDGTDSYMDFESPSSFGPETPAADFFKEAAYTVTNSSSSSHDVGGFNAFGDFQIDQNSIFLEVSAMPDDMWESFGRLEDFQGFDF